MEQYADICLLLNYSTCFGRPSLPSSGVHKTVVAACGTRGEQAFFNLELRSTEPRMDARNMYSNLAVNKYLHTVASRWISST